MSSNSNEVSDYSDDLTEASDKIDPVQVAKVIEYLNEEKRRKKAAQKRRLKRKRERERNRRNTPRNVEHEGYDNLNTCPNEENQCEDDDYLHKRARLTSPFPSHSTRLTSHNDEKEETSLNKETQYYGSRHHDQSDGYNGDHNDNID